MTDIYNSRPKRGSMYRSRWGMTKPHRNGAQAGRRRGWSAWLYPALWLMLCTIAIVLVVCYVGGGF